MSPIENKHYKCGRNSLAQPATHENAQYRRIKTGPRAEIPHCFDGKQKLVAQVMNDTRVEYLGIETKSQLQGEWKYMSCDGANGDKVQ